MKRCFRKVNGQWVRDEEIERTVAAILDERDNDLFYARELALSHASEYVKGHKPNGKKARS